MPAKKTSTRSRAKAPNKTERRGERQQIESIHWPVDEDGQPMAQISFCASELIPTGDYANVVVGPVQVTKFVKDENLAEQMNALAEMVESDCISEQRELVLGQIQAAVQNK